jgi:hypothetical protein
MFDKVVVTTRAAVDTVLAAYLTEQRRNSAMAEP